MIKKVQKKMMIKNINVKNKNRRVRMIQNNQPEKSNTNQTVNSIVNNENLQKNDDVIKRKNVQKRIRINTLPSIEKSLVPNHIQKTINNNINYSSVKPIFKGETIYLIGGGPSLAGFNFKLLNNKKVIAINKAILYYPKADVMYWTDTRVYNWFKKEIDEFSGLKYTIRNVSGPNINILRNTGKGGIEINAEGLRHGNNSGFAAINLAVHLGASRIVLLGYDMATTGKMTHWHNGYNNVNRTKESIYTNNMLPYFQTLVEPLQSLGIEIINANPNSEIKCFKKVSIDHALKY